jgi:glycosyltransferase involved in cell wall biosynthesis
MGAKRDHWWALLPIAPIEEAREEVLGLRARLRGGATATATLGSIELVPALTHGAEAPRAVHPARSTDPPIAICMATWNPPPDLFRRQIESIREQSYANWTCVISDDGSPPEALAAMRQVLDGDERFVLHPFRERLGFYRNFERALALAPPDAELVALCDQDDEWAPEKLDALRSSFGPQTMLAYSDMRIVSADGRVLSDTYWSFRRTNHTDLTQLLLANTITGAASMFRRELLDHALPFPPRLGGLFHDHWLAAVALSLGEIAYVDRPLYDYVQHRRAALGHDEANYGARRPRREWLEWARLVPAVALGARVPAFYTRVYLPTVLIARVIETRCAELIEPSRLRVIRAFAAGTHRLEIAPLLLPRALRPGLRRTATLGRERSFLAALAWQRLARMRGRLGVGPAPSETDLA